MENTRIKDDIDDIRQLVALLVTDLNSGLPIDPDKAAMVGELLDHYISKRGEV